MIRISDYPQLSMIVWNRPHDDLITGAEALAIYERNWAFVDSNALSANENALIKHLIEHYGNGVFATL